MGNFTKNRKGKNSHRGGGLGGWAGRPAGGRKGINNRKNSAFGMA